MQQIIRCRFTKSGRLVLEIRRSCVGMVEQAIRNAQREDSGDDWVSYELGEKTEAELRGRLRSRTNPIQPREAGDDDFIFALSNDPPCC